MDFLPSGVNYLHASSSQSAVDAAVDAVAVLLCCHASRNDTGVSLRSGVAGRGGDNSLLSFLNPSLPSHAGDATSISKPVSTPLS